VVFFACLGTTNPAVPGGRPAGRRLDDDSLLRPAKSSLRAVGAACDAAAAVATAPEAAGAPLSWVAPAAFQQQGQRWRQQWQCRLERWSGGVAQVRDGEDGGLASGRAAAGSLGL
jgi:hypothetical protein